jgi:hypothetical protein
MAKTQKVQAAFNKELQEAMRSGDELRRKKLQEMQPQMLKLTNQIMISNLKTMVFTMLIAILIWRWLYSYLDTITVDTLSLPWEASWPFSDTIKGVCPVPFPYWIAVYFVISVPFGQVLVNFFKLIEFSQEGKMAEDMREDELRKRLEKLSANIESARREGVSTMQLGNLKEKIELSLEEREFSRAEKQLEDAEAVLEQNISTRKRTQELVTTVSEMIASARAKGVDVSSIEPIYMNAKAAMDRFDYTNAIYYSKQVQQKLKVVKEKHGEAEEALDDLQKIISDTPASVKKVLKEHVSEAESAMTQKRYEDVMDNVKRLKGEADLMVKNYEMASEQLERAKGLLGSLKKLSINTTKEEDSLRHAEDKFNLGAYNEAVDMARDTADELEKLKKLYEDASESVSFAKLIVANAQNFGADVTKSEMLLNEAEIALSAHDYQKALQKATNAKKLAEESKRQIQRTEKRGRK